MTNNQSYEKIFKLKNYIPVNGNTFAQRLRQGF